MVPQLHSRDKITAETVGFCRRVSSEDGEDGIVAGKIMATVFKMHAELCKLKLDLFPHPPYSPDLTWMRRLFLFPNLKKWLSGNKLMSNDIIAKRNADLKKLDIR